MRGKQKLNAMWAKIKNIPKKYIISAAMLVFVVVSYSFFFLIPKTVYFSYDHAPCVDQFVLFPEIYKTTTDTPYEARPTNLVKVGPVTIASQSICFLPKQIPQEGDTRIGFAPFGGWFMLTAYVLKVENTPMVDASVFKKKIPASLPLVIPTNITDKLSRYTLRVNKSQVVCEPVEAAISCDMSQLKLLQGRSYAVEVDRQFNDQVVDLVKAKLSVLPATHILKTSLGAPVVYTKPKTIDVVFDKKIISMQQTVYHLQDGKRIPLKTDIVIKDKKAQIKLADELSRMAKFELIIESVQASDGSGLEKPYNLAFETSGGPKVTGISVGSLGVSMGTTAIITFDQPLSDEQDINQAVKLSGGATIAGRDGSQLFVSLARVPKCGDFGIEITNDLESSHAVKGGSEWRYGGRMICHEIGTIGYSQQGRPILAYYFGSGSTSIVYTGAIHGDERSTRDLMLRWIGDLEANARRIPAGKTVVIVPVINPDGLANGTRTNARNVDLNRNFATNDWRKDVTDVNNNPFPGGGGDSPMSESETQAVGSLIARLRPALVLSYHSVGGLLVANGAGMSSAKATAYAQSSGYYNATGQSSPFEYGVSGTVDDWYAQKLGVASILIELSSHTYHQFDRNRDAMWAMIQ